MTNIQYNAVSIRDTKPLTMELDEPVRRPLSGEGIYLPDVAAQEHKPPKISQASLRMVELQGGLIKEMKTMRLAGESTGDKVKDLAMAYDTVQKNLNENSESSQKHAKFLGDAFADMAQMFFSQDAYLQHRSTIDFSDDTQNPLLNKEAANLQKQAVADAKAKAEAFADSFLKNYKKHGLGAYDMAVAEIEMRR